MRFAMVPWPIVTGDLSPTAQRVGMLLAGYAPAQTHVAYPSVRRMAQDLRCSARTIQRGVAELEAAGYLTRTAHYAPGHHGQRANRYRLAAALYDEAGEGGHDPAVTQPMTGVSAPLTGVSVPPADRVTPPLSRTAPQGTYHGNISSTSTTRSCVSADRADAGTGVPPDPAKPLRAFSAPLSDDPATTGGAAPDPGRSHVLGANPEDLALPAPRDATGSAVNRLRAALLTQPNHLAILTDVLRPLPRPEAWCLSVLAYGPGGIHAWPGLAVTWEDVGEAIVQCAARGGYPSPRAVGYQIQRVVRDRLEGPEPLHPSRAPAPSGTRRLSRAEVDAMIVQELDLVAAARAAGETVPWDGPERDAWVRARGGPDWRGIL